MELKHISVVIPVYNEGSQIRQNFNEIRQRAEGLVGQLVASVQYVLVDDGSADNTWDELQIISREISPITCIRFSRNYGKEAAICSGLEYSSGAAVIVIDSDLQHPPELMAEMVRLWRDEGYDVVNAVKVERSNETKIYRTAAFLFNRMMTVLSGHDLSGSSDFKLLDRKVVTALCSLPERLRFYRGLVAWIGFRQSKIPMTVRPRAGGHSTWSLIQLIRLATVGLVSFSTSALHCVTIFGVLFLIIGAALGLATLISWIRGHALAGFPTVISLQLIIGSLTLIGMGIIGEYIATIFHEVKMRPRFLIQAVIETGRQE